MENDRNGQDPLEKGEYYPSEYLHVFIVIAGCIQEGEKIDVEPDPDHH
jgi:hypothetical protein